MIARGIIMTDSSNSIAVESQFPGFNDGSVADASTSASGDLETGTNTNENRH